MLTHSTTDTPPPFVQSTTNPITYMPAASRDVKRWLQGKAIAHDVTIASSDGYQKQFRSATINETMATIKHEYNHLHPEADFTQVKWQFAYTDMGTIEYHAFDEYGFEYIVRQVQVFDTE